MISEKDKSKLKKSILNSIYKEYDKTASPFINTIMLAVYFDNNYDQHDISLALKSLKADGFIEVDFPSEDTWAEYITITQNGIDYCHKNSNKVKKFILSHTFDIFNLIVAIVMGILGIIF